MQESTDEPAAVFQVNRLGVIMEPARDDPKEAEGVLNPAAIRGRDGELYLFPRLVARGNYSRIGMARVLFSARGNPMGIERLGVVLEPTEDYEKRPDGGGCEDPRITFVDAIDRFVMTYTAFGPGGPRIAIAISNDLFTWKRLGLVRFESHDGIAFEGIDNKDALVFPIAIPAPDGRMSLGMLHRPLFPGTTPSETAMCPWPRHIDVQRESIWIAHSFCPLDRPCKNDAHHLCLFQSHRRLASPVAPWEKLKIGGGTPPVLTRLGWLLLYHGVSDCCDANGPGYHAGIMILDRRQPHLIRYRSGGPVMSPEGKAEEQGVVNNVVFPTGIDQRTDIGCEDRFDVYYGMADERIGIARFDLPESLPLTGAADAYDVV